jgi:hypothetical protein
MIGKMLDWDKPLSEQPASLKPLLAEIEKVGSVAAEKIRTLATQPGVANWAKQDLLKDAAQIQNSKSPAHVAGVLKRMQLDYGISPDSGPFAPVANDFLLLSKECKLFQTWILVAVRCHICKPVRRTCCIRNATSSRHSRHPLPRRRLTRRRLTAPATSSSSPAKSPK